MTNERVRLEELIKEHNVTWSQDLGVRLELVSWETHAYPGIGNDPQSVINDQLPDDYDIFIGIMWHRFGTATKRAGSGTAEEFQRAKQRYEEDSSSVTIMVYFKDAPVSPSRIEPDQLSQVLAFRESLGDEGVLYWTFSKPDQFEDFIRLHLARQVQEWRKRLESTSSPIPQGKRNLDEPGQGPSDESTESDESDIGLIELTETFEDRFEKLAEITGRITQAIAEIGETVNSRTEEMGKLPRDSQGNLNRNAVKRLLKSTALDMDSFSMRLEGELPFFAEYLRSGIDSLTRAASLSVDFATDSEGRTQTEEGLDTIVALRTSLVEASQSISGFRDTTAGLPRLTSDLNKAKTRMSALLDDVVQELTSGEKLLREGENVVRELLEGEAASWDRQLEQDVAAGRLDTLAENAASDHASGRTKPL